MARHTARVAAREELTPLRDDPAARDLKLVCDYRAQLKAERTRTANRLHADLIQLAPGYQGRVPNLSGRVHLARAARLLGAHQGVQGDLARRRLATLRRLDADIAAAERQTRALVRAADSRLPELVGVGALARRASSVRSETSGALARVIGSPWPTARRPSRRPRGCGCATGSTAGATGASTGRFT